MKTYDSADIRTFALVGHGGSGKTSVGEAIALITGLNTRLGSVTDGSSLLDFEPEERERGGSLTTSFLTAEHDGLKLHIADTPGDGDFLDEAMTALNAVDGVVLVVSAVDGVETMTERMSHAAAERGLGRVVFINKLDRERTDHEPVLEEIRAQLGVEPVLLELPIGRGPDLRGVVDLIGGKAYAYEGDGGRGQEVPIPDDLAGVIGAAKEALVEAVATVDDELVEKYLEHGELTDEEFNAGLHKGIGNGALLPVLVGSATRNLGIDRLLSFAKAMPTPLERVVKVHPPGRPEATVELEGGAGTMVAFCFKTIVDPFMGQLSVFRVFRGGASTDSHPTNARTDAGERFGALLHLDGKKTVPADRVVAGDIFAVAKLKSTHTGDTLYEGEAVEVDAGPAPQPMISYVLKPVTRADEDKVRGALEKLLSEEAGLVQSFDEVTKEIVVGGRGANHVTVAVHKLKRKYGVAVELGTPTIPYRETISGTADVRYRHKKQTGGAGQFGEVAIRVRPADRDAGFEFEDKTVGGVIPHSLIPSVEKGVRWVLAKGALAGFPVVDVHVELYDGKSHPVDSKDI
ncbi:MAG: elongation factor G, partial [Myxococcales bacterium]|nr:elongation factor G [Myxococcales bacterium]